MKKNILFLIGILVWNISPAQQNPQYTQYIFNGLVINPAYAGSKEVINVNGLFRLQWTGLEGAPTTQTLTVDAPVYYQRAAVGVQIINDNIGPQRQTTVLGNFAYRVRVSTTGKLSLGLAAGASQYSLNGSKLNPDNINDPSIPNSTMSVVRPDARLGLYFNTHRFFAGISASEILSSLNNDNLMGIKQHKHYYLTSGVLINLSDRFKLKPSFLVKEDFKGPANIDLNAFILYNDFIWLGTSYRKSQKIFSNDSQDLRSRDAIALIAEVYPTEKFRIGYSYDFTLTGLSNYSTHEISIGYYFFKSTNTRMLTPRYF